MTVIAIAYNNYLEITKLSSSKNSASFCTQTEPICDGKEEEINGKDEFQLIVRCRNAFISNAKQLFYV